MRTYYLRLKQSHTHTHTHTHTQKPIKLHSDYVYVDKSVYPGARSILTVLTLSLRSSVLTDHPNRVQNTHYTNLKYTDPSINYTFYKDKRSVHAIQ